MPSTPLRVLALGDSYTVGEGVPADGRWPALLVHRLQREGLVLAEPQLVAATGWTTDELDAAMDAAAFNAPYALVTLLVGVNNQYRGRGVDEYRGQLRHLVARAVALAGDDARRVVLLSTPDWGVTGFARDRGDDAHAIAGAIDAFNTVAREEAARGGAHWLDITAISRACAALPGMLAADGLHPSATQYALWTQQLLPLARAILRDGA
ncbi:MAG TPA: GDSL-type esterase/lipase family protein [Rhodanobacteraceae bacterium]|nr:GDSL-type esterase/lipase family protein [Rhodanobacteraceae bacterium]